MQTPRNVRSAMLYIQLSIERGREHLEGLRGSEQNRGVSIAQLQNTLDYIWEVSDDVKARYAEVVQPTRPPSKDGLAADDPRS